MSERSRPTCELLAVIKVERLERHAGKNHYVSCGRRAVAECLWALVALVAPPAAERTR